MLYYSRKQKKSIKEESNFISSIKTYKLLILFQHQQSLYDDLIVEFFKKKGKENLLAFAPGNLDGKWKTTIAQRYGYIIGQNKLELLNKVKDWLEESTTLNVDGTKLNVERINSLGLLSELMNYDYELDKAKKANYDRIMSLIGCIVALRNAINQYEEKILKEDDNIYSAFKNRKMKTRYKTKSRTWITS